MQSRSLSSCDTYKSIFEAICPWCQYVAHSLYGTGAPRLLYLSPPLTPTIESAKRIVKLIPGRRLQGDCNDREPDQQVAELIFLHDILFVVKPNVGSWNSAKWKCALLMYLACVSEGTLYEILILLYADCV